MSFKLCPTCSSANCGTSTNYMTGTITQPFNPANDDPQITEFVCPYCGYEETETIPAPPVFANFNSGIGALMEPIVVGPTFGIYNSGIVQGPLA